MKRLFLFVIMILIACSSKKNIESPSVIVSEIHSRNSKIEEIRSNLYNLSGDEFNLSYDKFIDLQYMNVTQAYQFVGDFLTNHDIEKITLDDLKSLIEISKVSKDYHTLHKLLNKLYKIELDSRNSEEYNDMYLESSILLYPDSAEIIIKSIPDTFSRSTLYIFSLQSYGYAINQNFEISNLYFNKCIKLIDKELNSLCSKLYNSPPTFIGILSNILAQMNKKDEAIEFIKKYESKYEIAIKQNDMLRMYFDYYKTQMKKLDEQLIPFTSNLWLGSEKPIKISNYIGKVVLLEFSSINCGPCNRRVPFLKRLQEDFQNDFTIIGNLDFADENKAKQINDIEYDFELIKSGYYKQRKISWPINYSDKNSINYGILGTPTYILIDRKGKIREYIPIPNYSYIHERIKTLINEPA
jgi:thiol-disulfide isomerase/thioredoxin